MEICIFSALKAKLECLMKQFSALQTWAGAAPDAAGQLCLAELTGGLTSFLEEEELELALARKSACKETFAPSPSK